MKNRRRSILVAASDRSIVQSMRHPLEQAGFSVFVAYDGEQAAILAARQRYELIITDFELTESSGSIFCRYVREDLRLTEVPIAIFAKESFSDDPAALIFSCGVTRIFYKPVDPESVVEFAKEIVDYLLTSI